MSVTMCDLRICTKLRKMQILRTFSSFSSQEYLEFHAGRKPQVATPALKTKTVKAEDNRRQSATSSTKENQKVEHVKRVFSGIQPTGSLHLGNYLGAVKQWSKLQEAYQHTCFCIVDLHSITMPQVRERLRDNIIELAATMFACGIDQNKSTIFVQSAIKEHTELSWILGTQATVARLGHLPQYKEKSRLLKEIPLGLFLYPVLQAADICLYKSTHVPVGEDQIQHIQLAQHLAKTFNNSYGETFPICHAIIDQKEAARIRSFRDPSKKMSKSDPDPRATINIMDEPEDITEKFKKALTDFTSDVTYDPEQRPGVSNIVAIHSLITGNSIHQVLEEALTLDTARYKLRVADAVIEHLKPIRAKIAQQLQRRNEVAFQLEEGAKKARIIAAETMAEVKNKVGLGTNYSPFLSDSHSFNKDNTSDRPLNINNLMKPTPNLYKYRFNQKPASATTTKVIDIHNRDQDILKK